MPSDNTINRITSDSLNLFGSEVIIQEVTLKNLKYLMIKPWFRKNPMKYNLKKNQIYKKILNQPLIPISQYKSAYKDNKNGLKNFFLTFQKSLILMRRHHLDGYILAWLIYI